MNKQGFTLIELLAIIVILAVIALIAFPAVQSAIQTSREKTLDEQKNTIVNAGKRYVADNIATFNTTTCYLTIDKLKSAGYLTSNKDIINPVTNTKLTGCVKVTKDTTNKQYKYSYSDSCGTACS